MEAITKFQIRIGAIFQHESKAMDKVRRERLPVIQENLVAIVSALGIIVECGKTASKKTMLILFNVSMRSGCPLLEPCSCNNIVLVFLVNSDPIVRQASFCKV